MQLLRHACQKLGLQEATRGTFAYLQRVGGEQLEGHEARCQGNAPLSQVWQPALSDQLLAEGDGEGAGIAHKCC